MKNCFEELIENEYEIKGIPGAAQIPANPNEWHRRDRNGEIIYLGHALGKIEIHKQGKFKK